MPGLGLCDGVTRIFLNTRGSNAEGVSDELISLLRYFEHSTEATAESSGSDKVLRLHEKVEKLRESEEIGVKFMNAWEEKLLDRQDGYEEGLQVGQAEGEKRGIKKGIAEGEKRGRETGIVEGEKRVAAKLKASGMATGEISRMTGLSETEIEKL